MGGKRIGMSKELIKEVDSTRIAELQQRIETNSDLIEVIVNKLVQDYCKPLDEYVSFIRSILNDSANPPTDTELDDFVLNIPTLLYFTGEAQESLGIKEDVAKAVKQELFSEVYAAAVGTIGDKTAAAELLTQNEYIVHTAYQRAYKKVKLRMEAAYELLQSVKKVISRRTTEYELSRIDPSRIVKETR